jgi:hypothetical protein
VKRSPIAIRSLAAAVLLATTMSGCSLFKPAATNIESQAVPITPTGSTGQAPGTPSSAESASPLPTPTVTASAPSLPAVTGYSLASPSGGVVRRFQAVSGKYRGVFSGLTARTVVKGRHQVGTVVLLGLNPELVGNTAVEQRLVPGMVKGMSGKGVTVKTRKVGGQDVAVATTRTTNIVAWYRSGAVVLVLANGKDTAPALAFAKAYLAAR